MANTIITAVQVSSANTYFTITDPKGNINGYTAGGWKAIQSQDMPGYVGIYAITDLECKISICGIIDVTKITIGSTVGINCNQAIPLIMVAVSRSS
jgi:hypothetical protein